MTTWTPAVFSAVLGKTLGSLFVEKRQIQDLLERLRRRTLWIGGFAGLGWGLLAALACLFLGAWLDLLLEFPPALRISVLGLAALAIVVLIVLMYLAARRTGQALFIAGRLDDLAHSHGQIASGVQLAAQDQSAAYSPNPDLTASLSNQAVKKAAQLAQCVEESEAAPLKPVGRSFLAFATSAFVVMLLIFFAPRMAKTQWSRLVDPYGDTPPYSRIHFQVLPAGAEVIYGQGLEIETVVEGGEVDQVELVLEGLEDGESLEVIPMFEEGAGKWRSAIANVRKPLRYFVRSRRARSVKYDLHVVTVPRIDDVRFHIVPPAYSSLAEYKGPLPQGGLAGLPGTKVTVTAISNRPLSAGLATVTIEEKPAMHKMRPVSGREQEVMGSFVITGDGQLDLSVTDTSSQNSVEKYSAPIILLPDHRPFVRLLEPRENSFATPSAYLPVVISGEDDYGIAKLELYRSLNDSRPLPRELPVSDPPAKTAYQVEYLPLGAYGLEPGDEIKIFARVTDNDPVGGPENTPGKGSESSVVVVRIISEMDFQRVQRSQDSMQLLMSKYQEGRRRMESAASETQKLIEELKQELEKNGKQAPLSETLRKKIQQLAEKLAEEQESLDRLTKDQLPYEMDKQLNPEMQKMKEMLQRLQKQTEELAQNQEMGAKQAQEHLDQMLDQLQQQQEEFEQDAMLPLEAMEKVFRLTVDEKRFEQLAAKQRDLATRLAAMKGRDDEDNPTLKARMRDLEAEQRQLQDQLGELMDDIEKHAEQLPPDLPEVEEMKQSALEFAQKVRESGAGEAMGQGADGLSEFSGTRGHGGARKAADLLEQFLEQGGGTSGNMQGQGEKSLGGFQPQAPGFGKGMGDTLQQLLDDAGYGKGSSTRMNSSRKNVGLYGGTPEPQSQPSSQGAKNEQTITAPGQFGARAGSGEGGDGGYETGGSLEAAGSGEASVPLRYRRKVGRYFQRIADELGDP